MKITYKIVSCVRSNFQVMAQINGRDVEATVPGLIIEGVSDDGAMGHTFKFYDGDIDAAYDRAKAGGTLSVTLDVVDAAGKSVPLGESAAKPGAPATPGAPPAPAPAPTA